jgi:hypothetical protein
MSKSILAALLAVGLVAACAPKPEPVAAPVSEEPVSNGKY